MTKEINSKERMQIIADNITYYRKLNGITQKELAEKIGIKPSTMTDYMKLRSAPSYGIIQKIADYFGVSVDYLMTGEEKQGYYLNEETAKLAQEMYEDEDMRSLFDMKRNMPPERFKAHMEFMKNLYKQEKGDF